MKTEIEDLAWRCLPREAREEIRYEYRKTLYQQAKDVLCYFFGHHNLTSDEEPPELLFVERKKVQEIYHQIKLELGDGGCSEYQDDINMEKENMLESLFGKELFNGKEK